MTQRETSVSINGFWQRVVYFIVEAEDSTIIEGLIGNVAFRLSKEDANWKNSTSLDDPAVRTPLMEAIFANEGTRSQD